MSVIKKLKAFLEIKIMKNNFEAANVDATQCLKVVIDYIRGNKNLDQSIIDLSQLGLDKESALNVLNDTPRDNIVDIKNHLKIKL